jgi:hypothetical protein
MLEISSVILKARVLCGLQDLCTRLQNQCGCSAQNPSSCAIFGGGGRLLWTWALLPLTQQGTQSFDLRGEFNVQIWRVVSAPARRSLWQRVRADKGCSTLTRNSRQSCSYRTHRRHFANDNLYLQEIALSRKLILGDSCPWACRLQLFNLLVRAVDRRHAYLTTKNGRSH